MVKSVGGVEAFDNSGALGADGKNTRMMKRRRRRR